MNGLELCYQCMTVCLTAMFVRDIMCPLHVVVIYLNMLKLSKHIQKGFLDSYSNRNVCIKGCTLEGLNSREQSSRPKH